MKSEVELRLTLLLEEDSKRAGAHGRDVALMHEALSDLCLRGGKRLRAALVAAGYRAALPGADLEPVLDAGVAVELLHAYFLVHDDWMDGDARRRGGPSVHRLLSRRLGNAELGAASAILAGDYLSALATRSLSEVDVGPPELKQGFRVFAEMQRHAVMGQQIDLLARASTVLHTYALKTGSYSAAGPLELGARLGGGSNALAAALIHYGVPLGVAFQLRDDLLGVFGDPRVTGKPIGSDLASGKRTALVLAALKKLRGRDKKRFTAIWGKASATRAELREAAELCESSGARTAVERRVGDLVSEAERALETSAIEPDARELLLDAASALTVRDA